MNLIKGAAARKLGVDMIGIRPEDVIMPGYASGADGSAGAGGHGADGSGAGRSAGTGGTGAGDTLELVLPKASMHLFRAGQRVTA